MKITSSVSPARSAASRSSGIVHHPPIQRRRLHLHGDAQGAARGVQCETRNADGGDEKGAARRVAAESREIQSDAPERVRSGFPEQEDHERHERETEEYREDLVHDVPDAPARPRLGLSCVC